MEWCEVWRCLSDWDLSLDVSDKELPVGQSQSQAGSPAQERTAEQGNVRARTTSPSQGEHRDQLFFKNIIRWRELIVQETNWVSQFSSFSACSSPCWLWAGLAQSTDWADDETACCDSQSNGKYSREKLISSHVAWCSEKFVWITEIS